MTVLIILKPSPFPGKHGFCWACLVVLSHAVLSIHTQYFYTLEMPSRTTVLCFWRLSSFTGVAGGGGQAEFNSLIHFAFPPWSNFCFFLLVFIHNRAATDDYFHFLINLIILRVLSIKCQTKVKKTTLNYRTSFVQNPKILKTSSHMSHFERRRAANTYFWEAEPSWWFLFDTCLEVIKLVKDIAVDQMVWTSRLRKVLL